MLIPVARPPHDEPPPPPPRLAPAPQQLQPPQQSPVPHELPVPADRADPEQWAQLLAIHEGSQRSRLAEMMSRRGVRIAVALVGTLVVMAGLSAAALILGAMAG